MYILTNAANVKRAFHSLDRAVLAYIGCEHRKEYPHLSGLDGPIEFRMSPSLAKRAGYSLREIIQQFVE